MESALTLLSMSMEEANGYICRAFNEASTYADLCFAAKESKRMQAEMDRKSEIAWMCNLKRVLGKEVTDEG